MCLDSDCLASSPAAPRDSLLQTPGPLQLETLKRRVEALARDSAELQTAIVDPDTSPQELLTKMREDASAKKHLVQQLPLLSRAPQTVT